MKRFVFPLVGAAMLLLPALASAKLINDLPAVPGVTVQRQGRRSVRDAAKRPIWRNPSQLRFGESALTGLYENHEFALSIRYPAEWERNDVDDRDATLVLPVMFLSPIDGASSVRQNVNLVIEKLEKPMTLAEYTELGIANEKKFFADYALLSSMTVPVGGSLRGQRITFTATTDSGGPMKFTQVWVVRDTQAYVWTFADTAKTFDRNVGTFERMLDSYIMR